MSTAFRPAQTGFSRVFLVDGRARPDHCPVYQGNMKAGSVSQSFGDIEKVEVPSTTEWGKFIEVGSIRGAEERVTITLTGRYAADLRSEMLRLALAGCAFDIHINFGACTDPQNNNIYSKKLILEDALITNYSTEDLGALGSDEQAKVDESIEVSARLVYEILPLAYAERASDLIVTPVVDTAICGNPQCGDCDDEDTGCDFIIAITGGAGGSPTTMSDITWAIDGGAVFTTADIGSMSVGDEPDEVDCVADYVVVVTNDGAAHEYALSSEFTVGGAPLFTEVTSTDYTAGPPNAIDSYGQEAFIVGDAGYIYLLTDPTFAPTTLDAGAATSENLNDVDALSALVAVAVGVNNAVVHTVDGSIWTTVTGPAPATALSSVEVISANVWLVGTATGEIYYTTDTGQSWTLSLNKVGDVTAISFANDTVGYASIGAVIYQTNDGGCSWVISPASSGQTLPANQDILSVTACVHRPDFVVAGGTATGGTDGILLIGS